MNVYQEPKYKIENGKLVNRQSGEAIPDDEPVFILRARDKHAGTTLLACSMRVKDPKHHEAAKARAAQFNNWANCHPGRMKEPDTQLDNGWTTAGTPTADGGK